jgi:hypothetical protein
MRRLLVASVAPMLVAALLMLGPPASGDDVPCAIPGGTGLSPAKTYDLPDGGTAYEFIIDGIVNTFPVPPADFVPLKATDEELAEYALPPRPTDDIELASWESEMALLRSSPIPTPCLVQSVSGFFQPAPPDGSEPDITTSSNWSGYAASDPGVDEWEGVQSDWTQPTGQNTCTADYESTWVGLGGFYDPPGRLLQAGTTMHHASGYPFAWYEYLNDSGGILATALPNVNVHSGDAIHVEVLWLSEITSADFFVVDNTNGTFQTITVSNLSAYYDGSTGDFIDERPMVGPFPPGHLSALRNYGTVSWTNTKVQNATTGSWQSLGTQTKKKYKMVANDGTTVLSKPDALSSNTSFTDRWKACGP